MTTAARSEPASFPSAGRLRFLLLNFALLLGNLLVLFNTGAFASISLHATGALGVSPSHAAWIQSYYFVSLALSLPLQPWLSARAGVTRLYLSALLLMAFGSLLCALTDAFGWFIAGRIAQGFFGGLTLPLSQLLFLRLYPASRQSIAVGIWSMTALSPFTLGPAVGGWMADYWGWRSLFSLNVPLTLLAAALSWALLPKMPSPLLRRRLDIIGFALLALALACLQSVLNQGEDEDWYNSQPMVLLTLTGVVALLLFGVWELGERYPLLDLRLFRRRNFVIGTLCLSVGFMLMYGLLSVLLVRLQTVAGYTSFLAGASLLPLLFLTKPMANFYHRLVHRFDARLLASVNLLAFFLYSYWTGTYDFFQRGGWFSEMLLSQVLEGFCLGGFFVPLTTLLTAGLTPRRQLDAVQLAGMLRVLGGSIGSPLLSVIWDRRAAFQQNHLIETFSTYDALHPELMSRLRSAGIEPAVALIKLAQQANRHAAIIGLDDTFRLAAWLYLGMAALVWLARPLRPHEPRSEKAGVRETVLEDLIEEP